MLRYGTLPEAEKKRSSSSCAGLCYSELSTRFPTAGSAYFYVYATAGELIAFLVGWALVLEYGLAACLSAKALSRHVAALSYCALRVYHNGSGADTAPAAGSSDRLLARAAIARAHERAADRPSDRSRAVGFH